MKHFFFKAYWGPEEIAQRKTALPEDPGSILIPDVKLTAVTSVPRDLTLCPLLAIHARDTQAYILIKIHPYTKVFFLKKAYLNVRVWLAVTSDTPSYFFMTQALIN